MNDLINKDLVIIEEDLEDLLTNFFKNRKKEIASLSQVIEKENFSQIAIIAHSLKGTSGSYGFHYMCDLAREIEYSAKEKNLSLAKIKLCELKRHFENMEVILQ